MTISTSTDSQISAATAAQAKKDADLQADQKADQKSEAAAKSADAPAVVVNTAEEAKVDETLQPRELDSADEALSLAQSIGAALGGQASSIANNAPGQVAGLLSEFEAA